ncbi:MAG: YjjG family noncanonical pyrimidine nucleotidase [Raineya sp.]|jgi:putative hydrolase of the HAD superfamily|nr:YjjG family noncanonical pyrimidine nucleotidase [Raineya sp.]
MRQYQHIFFDLDHTLWDFEKNSNETLVELHEEHLEEEQVPIHQFLETFHRINEHLWHLHDTYQISSQELRESRFKLIFKEFDLENADLISIFGERYLARTPKKPYLLPNAKEILDYLHPKYKLHIITNGFPEIQRVKMQSSGILDYFDEIVTSAEAGCKKPETGIFTYLMDKLQIQVEDCIMIGDNLLTDILGAQKTGIDTVFYNPKNIEHQEQTNYEINCLGELKSIL